MPGEFPYLYPHSSSEAQRSGETQMHMDSFYENVKCARAIEQAVRDHFDEANEALTDGCAQAVLEQFGFKRVNFVLANSLQELQKSSCKHLVSDETYQWGRKTFVPPDGKFNRYFAADTAAGLLESFIRQTRDAYQALGMFGPEHCVSGDDLDYDGKVLVLSPGTLKESHWTPATSSGWAKAASALPPTPEGRRSTPPVWGTVSKPAGTVPTSPACWTSSTSRPGRRKGWRRFRTPSKNSRRPLRRNGDDIRL